MSYSFTVRAATKALAKLAVAAKFAEVAAAQVCHERDKSQALAAAGAFIDLVSDDESKDISVSMNGSLTGHWTGSDVTRVEGAAVSVYAGLVAREAAKA